MLGTRKENKQKQKRGEEEGERLSIECMPAVCGTSPLTQALETPSNLTSAKPRKEEALARTFGGGVVPTSAG